MIAGQEERTITIRNSRSCWRESVQDEDDLVKVIKLLQAEIFAGNKIGLVIAIEKIGLPSRMSLSLDEE